GCYLQVSFVGYRRSDGEIASIAAGSPQVSSRKGIIIDINISVRDTTHDGSDDLAVSLILCLKHLYPFLASSSSYFKSMFWVAMSIVQISDVKLFHATMPFMQVTTQTSLFVHIKFIFNIGHPANSRLQSVL